MGRQREVEKKNKFTLGTERCGLVKALKGQWFFRLSSIVLRYNIRDIQLNFSSFIAMFLNVEKEYLKNLIAFTII